MKNKRENNVRKLYDNILIKMLKKDLKCKYSEYFVGLNINFTKKSMYTSKYIHGKGNKF